MTASVTASLDAVGVVALVVLIAAAFVIYMLPTLIGASRKVVNVGSVFAINLLLGWTLIGWAIALAMALRTNPPYAYNRDRSQAWVPASGHPASTAQSQPTDPVTNPGKSNADTGVPVPACARRTDVSHYLELSTAHLPPQLLKRLGRLPGVPSWTHDLGGYILVAADDSELLDAASDGAPREILDLMRYAMALDCSLIDIRRDVRPVDGLPRYDVGANG